MNTLPIWEKKKSITMTVYFSMENRDARKEWLNTFQMLIKKNQTNLSKQNHILSKNILVKL